jgi:hypothetical protein
VHSFTALSLSAQGKGCDVHAVVLVPRESKAAACADLKGKTVGLPADSREH